MTIVVNAFIKVSFFAYLWNFGTNFNTLVFQSFGQKVLYLCAFRDFGTWNCDCYSRSVAIALASLQKYALVTLNNSFLSNLPIALSAKKNKGASHGLFFDHLVSLSYWQNLLSNWLKSCCYRLIYCHLKDSREPIIYQNHK